MQLLRSLAARTRADSELVATKNNIRYWGLKRGGPFPPEMQGLYCQMARAGCGCEKIAFVIGSVEMDFGIESDCLPSGRSVPRFDIKGSVAAEIQLGYDLLASR